MKRELHRSFVVFLVFICYGISYSAEPSSPVRVACVGDSITFGAGIENREANSYPAQLQQLLGNGFEVANFGISSRTLLKKGDLPYWNEAIYQEALEFQPHYVIIKLGTNDIKPENWGHRSEFAKDLKALAESFLALDSEPVVFLSYPAPVQSPRWGMTEQNILEGVIPLVDKVAEELNLAVIDFHSAIPARPGFFTDGIHPNAEGAKRMAEAVLSMLQAEGALEETGDSIPLAGPLRVEAEEMVLQNYQVAGDGTTEYIQLTQPKGVAEFEFPLLSGTYDIDARYLSESAGQNTYSLYLGETQIIAWLGKDRDDKWHRISEQKWHPLRNIEIEKGEQIRIEALSDNGSLVILDYLEFSPSTKGNSDLKENLITIHPEEYEHAIRNPLKGFRPDMDLPHEYGTLSKVYIRWNELENTIDDGVDKILALSDQKWSGVEQSNKKVIPRVYLDWPDRSSGWPADMTEGDYTSDHFAERVINLIRKLGEAWDRDSRVAYVEMGLIGEWGEMEWPDTTDYIKGAIAAQFAKSFRNKIVMIRWPNTYNDDIYNFGYYWDSFAHHDQAYYAYHLETTSPRWKTAVIGGETAYNWGNVKIQPGESPEESLANPLHRDHVIDQVRRLHANHVGWIADYDHNIESVRLGAEMLQKALGYRFIISEFTYPKRIEHGERFVVSFKVRNTGSSPFYYQWPVELSLLDPESKTVVWKEQFTDVDIRDWLPGDKWNPETNSYEIPAEDNLVTQAFVPAGIPSGEYIIAVSILDPAGNQPAVRLAINNYHNGGRHPIGKVGVDQTIETFNILEFDDMESDDSLSYDKIVK